MCDNPLRMMRASGSPLRGKRLHVAAILALLAVGLQIGSVAAASFHERWEARCELVASALPASGVAGAPASGDSHHHEHSRCLVCQLLAQVRAGAFVVSVLVLLLMPDIVPEAFFAASSEKPCIAPVLSRASPPRAPPVV